MQYYICIFCMSSVITRHVVSLQQNEWAWICEMASQHNKAGASCDLLHNQSQQDIFSLHKLLQTDTVWYRIANVNHASVSHCNRTEVSQSKCVCTQPSSCLWLLHCNQMGFNWINPIKASAPWDRSTHSLFDQVVIILTGVLHACHLAHIKFSKLRTGGQLAMQLKEDVCTHNAGLTSGN